MASKKKAFASPQAAVGCQLVPATKPLSRDMPASLRRPLKNEARADFKRYMVDVHADDRAAIGVTAAGKGAAGLALNALTMASRGAAGKAIELNVSAGGAERTSEESSAGMRGLAAQKVGTIFLNPAGCALFDLAPQSTLSITAHRSADGQVLKLSTILADAIEEVGIAHALRESREELRRLSGLLVSIQEDERRRIALDLHDGLGQSISLIKLAIEKSAGLLAAGAPDLAGDSLRQLIPRVEEALVEVRRVSTDLRPLMLDDLGMLPTLAWFFREFEAVCDGIVIERTFNVAERDVPAPLHITLYRILQEAIHNIVKHSHADRVRVRLDRIDDGLQLAIEDNGRGFDPDSVKWVQGRTRGLGLLSMKERACLSGGTYRLDSTPGNGTRIQVTWPAAHCTASVDCCRAAECGKTQVPCGAINATQFGGPKNTVDRV